MGWTPPSKFVVILTFLFMAFGIFIFLDVNGTFWTSLLPTFDLFGYNAWFLIGLLLFFLTWFFFFLGVKLKGF